MQGPGSTIAIGSFRIPTLVVGLSVSIAAHGALMTTLAFIHVGRRQPLAMPPALEFALGEPIQVRIVSEQNSEQSTRDEKNPAPEPPEPVAAIPEVPLAEIETQRTQENQTITDALEPKSNRAPALQWSVDLTALAETFRSIDWSSLAPSSKRLPGSIDMGKAEAEEQDLEQAGVASISAEKNEGVPPATLPVVASHSRNEPSKRDTPRGIDRGAKVIDLPQPVYPRRSIRLKQEGTAVVEVFLRADGAVHQVRLRTSSGHDLLDDAAMTAARKGRFSPALEDGQPIDAIVVVPFEFTLTILR